MNALDWRKATAFLTQQKQTATTAQTEQLSSMPLSVLSLDDSGPPMVQYGSHMLLAPSTSNSTLVHVQTHSRKILIRR